MIELFSWQFFAGGAAFFEGVTTIVAKKSLHRHHSLPIAAATAILVALISLPFLLILKPVFSQEIVLLAVLAAVFGSLAFFYALKSLHHLEISVAAPMMAVNPVVLAILAFAFLGESLNSTQILGILLVVFGAYVLELSVHHPDLLRPVKKFFKSKYLIFLFVSAFLYAFASMTDKVALGKTQVVPFLLLVNVLMAVVFVMVVYFADKHRLSCLKTAVKSGQWRFTLVMAFSVLFYRFFIFNALSMALVSLVIPVRRLSSLFATLIGGELFHERHLMQKLFAAVIMLSGVYFVASGA
ncbi:MAG: EamA family transporter [Candidatus Micrarchaeia archaeon]